MVLDRPLLKVAIATFVAPIAGSFTTWVGFLLFAVAWNGWTHAEPELGTVLGNAFLVAGVTALFPGLPAMLLFGLLIHAVFVRCDYSRSFGYVFGGAIAGLLVVAIFAPILSPVPLSEQGPLPGLGAVQGGLTAAYFWLIRRPDRDTPNPPTSAS